MPDRLGTIDVVNREATLNQAKQIAEAEMVRRRRRLGALTSEQELAIEKLLTSTVTKVSDLVGNVVESWAYLLDYKPIDRPKYLERSFPNIDWDTVEKG